MIEPAPPSSEREWPLAVHPTETEFKGIVRDWRIRPLLKVVKRRYGDRIVGVAVQARVRVEDVPEAMDPMDARELAEQAEMDGNYGEVVVGHNITVSAGYATMGAWLERPAIGLMILAELIQRQGKEVLGTSPWRWLIIGVWFRVLVRPPVGRRPEPKKQAAKAKPKKRAVKAKPKPKKRAVKAKPKPEKRTRKVRRKGKQ